ncbi:MAG: pilus assembly protein TadG-related protein [Comamonas sp.]
MRLHSPDLSDARTRRQSGSVAMLGALWLMVAVICLATIDIGNVFWQKRELQKIADLAALAGASGPLVSSCSSNKSASVYLNASANGLLAGELLEPIVGKWVASDGGTVDKGLKAVDASSKDANACKVQIKRNVPYFFMFSVSGSDKRIVNVTAIARQLPQLAKITIRSTLLSLNTDDSILEPLLNGLLGSAVKIDAAGWKGLVNYDVDLLKYLNLLSVKLNLKVGDYETLLKTDVDVDFLLNAMIDLLPQEATASAQTSVLRVLLAAVRINPVKVKLSELLNLSTGLNDAALKASLNAIDMASALVLLANSKNAVNANILIPSLLSIVDAKINVKIIEPPQWAIGNPAFDVIVAKTSQMKLGIATNANLLGLADLKLRLFVEVGSGQC